MPKRRPHPRRALFAASLSPLIVLVIATGCCRSGGPPPTTQPMAPASMPAAKNADLLEGDWSGDWKSTSNDMTGALRCRIVKLPGGDYEATFDATFASVLNHHSVIKLKVRERREVWTFGGKEDLGVLAGGVYTYDGQSNGEDFSCTYDSEYDKGIFKMRRGGPASRP